MDNREKIFDRIRKLFWLGKSPNMNEAAAAIKKAEALMSEHGLTFGEVNYVKEDIPGKKRNPGWEGMLFEAVCRANNCQSLLYARASRHGGNRVDQGRRVVGRDINVFLSIEMFSYLKETVNRLAKRECGGKGRTYHNDFKVAATIAIAEKLEKYGASVLWAVDRDDELKSIDGYIGAVEIRKNIVGYRNGGAFDSGTEAGNGVNLHRQTGLEETRLIGGHE